MTEHSLWRFSRALQRAINERQFEDIESVIDEDVDWAIYGPIDMFPFFGARRGREAVIDVIRQIADNVRVRRFDRESVLLGVELGGVDAAVFADGARIEQADLAARRAFRAVQGRAPAQHPGRGRYVRSRRAGYRPTDSSAEDGFVRVSSLARGAARRRDPDPSPFGSRRPLRKIDGSAGVTNGVALTGLTIP